MVMVVIYRKHFILQKFSFMSNLDLYVYFYSSRASYGSEPILCDETATAVEQSFLVAVLF